MGLSYLLTPILQQYSVTNFKDIPKPIWLFTAIWFVLGCIQAALMDLHPDEAYYWQMSRFMDWGYFHQPPMIAAFIKIGYAIFQSEFGVRLIVVLTSSIGIILLFKLSETKNVKTFLLVYLGLILTHAGVFMAVPDSPLVFFTLVFLVILKEYLNKDSVALALLLGIVAAALMYSKYHAVVLFASIIIALPKILLRKSFWLTALVGVGLFVPHVLWQFDYDLVSFKFHWVVREKKVWDVMVLLDYLLGQIIMLGPVGIILVIALVKLKNRTPFDRILTSIIIGFFGFFFVMALRGKVEANWTATAFLPLIILGTRVISEDEKLLKILKPTSIAMASLLIIARCYIASPWAGDGLKLSFPLKGWETWATQIKTKADGLPVFFSNSYQLASQYSFYSGEQGYHWSPLNYNGNQFELWDIDKRMEGKPFLLASGMGERTGEPIIVSGFNALYLNRFEEYHSYRKLRFNFAQTEYQIEPSSNLILEAVLANNSDAPLNLDELLQNRPVYYFLYADGKTLPAKQIECLGCEGIINSGESKPVSFSIEIPEVEGRCFIRFGLDFALGMPEQNSDFIKLIVTDK